MRLPPWSNPAIDIAMTISLVLVMGYQAMAPAAHFAIGLALAFLLSVHTWLHRRWYMSLTRGKWTPLRAFTAFVNLALPTALLVTIASGLLLAFPRSIFRFFITPARTAHLIFSHWSLVLAAIHLGLHGAMIAARMKRKCPPKIFRALSLSLYPLAAWGAWLFIELRLHTYLFGEAIFAFLDFKKPALQVFTEWGAIIVCIAFLTHSVSCLARRISH